MTVPELFALPAGSRVLWPICGTSGVVAARDDVRVTVLREDGQECILTPGEDDLAELADNLEVVRVGAGADVPLVVG